MKSFENVVIVLLVVVAFFFFANIIKKNNEAENSDSQDDPGAIGGGFNFDREDTKAFNKMRSYFPSGTIPLDDIVSRAYSAERYTIGDKPSKALTFIEEVKKIGAFSGTSVFNDIQFIYNQFYSKAAFL